MRQWLLYVETPIHIFASGKFNRLTCAALSTCERPTRSPNGACQEARVPPGLSMTLASQISGECSGPLVIGASEPIASHFIPTILKPFLADHPKVYPNIFSGPSSI